MDRLMILQLEAGGCSAEVQLNGMPIAWLGAAGGRICVPVHEYALAGRNQITLVACGPIPGMAAASQPRVASVPTWARATLVLARQGQSPSDANVRQLVSVEWAAVEGRGFDAPATETREVDLPIGFPRWRWLDAPLLTIGPAVARSIVEFLQELAVELSRGNPDPLLVAAKLRFDELALAYQMAPADAVQRFRDQVQRLYADKSLKVAPPLMADVVLRPIVGGRLIECLTPLGGPVLRTQNEDAKLGNQAWPIRLAMVEGKIYVLR